MAAQERLSSNDILSLSKYYFALDPGNSGIALEKMIKDGFSEQRIVSICQQIKKQGYHDNWENVMEKIKSPEFREYRRKNEENNRKIYIIKGRNSENR